MADNDLYVVWGWMEDFFEKHPVDPPQRLREVAARVLQNPDQLRKLGELLASELHTPYTREAEES